MSKQKQSLNDRMKRYEGVADACLIRRIPAVIRIDGKAFHTFTKGMKKPFDRILMSSMQKTMQYLCESIPGCVLGYTQSDEITLVLIDYAKPDTDAWFGYSVQKMCSVSASMATAAFNRYFAEEVRLRTELFPEGAKGVDENWFYLQMLAAEKVHQAMFDARVFSVPKAEVCNCLIWRQQDATRNSIEATGQAFFSHEELNGKSCNEVQEMLWREHDINWNDLPIDFKRGACCRRVERKKAVPDRRNDGELKVITRRQWEIDRQIPIFTKNRAYIEELL